MATGCEIFSQGLAFAVSRYQRPKTKWQDSSLVEFQRQKSSGEGTVVGLDPSPFWQTEGQGGGHTGQPGRLWLV